MKIEISKVEKQSTDVVARMVCTNCGHVFNELTYDIFDKTFDPGFCPSCGKPIWTIRIPSFERAPDGQIHLGID